MDEVGREIQRAKREEAQRRKERWTESHPRTAAFKSGWGEAFAKEGRNLVNDLSREMRNLLK